MRRLLSLPQKVSPKPNQRYDSFEKGDGFLRENIFLLEPK